MSLKLFLICMFIYVKLLFAIKRRNTSWYARAKQCSTRIQDRIGWMPISYYYVWFVTFVLCISSDGEIFLHTFFYIFFGRNNGIFQNNFNKYQNRIQDTTNFNIIIKTILKDKLTTKKIYNTKIKHNSHPTLHNPK